MTNAELIKALRYCGNFEDRDGCDEECPYFNDKDCPKRIMCDAADALEADDKRIAELEEEHNKTVTEIFWEEQLWWENRCKELEAARMELTTKCRRLEAQLPKEGEWIVEQIDDSGFKWCKWRCSACREIIKRGWQHTKDGEKPRWKYCPNCGARMKGENADADN